MFSTTLRQGMMDPGFLPDCVTLESSGFGLLRLCFFKQGCPAHSVSGPQLRLGWESTLYSESCMHISHGYLKNSALTSLLIEYLLRTWFYSTKYGQSSNMEESGKKKLLALLSGHLHFIKCLEEKQCYPYSRFTAPEIEDTPHAHQVKLKQNKFCLISVLVEVTSSEF